MVCATIDSQTDRTTPSTIAGGFVLVPVSSLIAAWRACQTHPLGIGDFRTWLAAHEILARRCKLDHRRQATYGVPELAGLLGIGRKRAAASLKRLEAAGLVAWSESSIRFPDQNDRAEKEIVDDLSDTIARGRGRLAIPRRLLRFLGRLLGNRFVGGRHLVDLGEHRLLHLQLPHCRATGDRRHGPERRPVVRLIERRRAYRGDQQPVLMAG